MINLNIFKKKMFNYKPDCPHQQNNGYKQMTQNQRKSEK